MTANKTDLSRVSRPSKTLSKTHQDLVSKYVSEGWMCRGFMQELVKFVWSDTNPKHRCTTKGMCLGMDRDCPKCRYQYKYEGCVAAFGRFQPDAYMLDTSNGLPNVKDGIPHIVCAEVFVHNRISEIKIQQYRDLWDYLDYESCALTLVLVDEFGSETVFHEEEIFSKLETDTEKLKTPTMCPVLAEKIASRLGVNVDIIIKQYGRP